MEPSGGASPYKNNNGLMDEDEGEDEATTGQIVSAFTRSKQQIRLDFRRSLLLGDFLPKEREFGGGAGAHFLSAGNRT